MSDAARSTYPMRCRTRRATTLTASDCRRNTAHRRCVAPVLGPAAVPSGTSHGLDWHVQHRFRSDAVRSIRAWTLTRLIGSRAPNHRGKRRPASGRVQPGSWTRWAGSLPAKPILRERLHRRSLGNLTSPRGVGVPNATDYAVGRSVAAAGAGSVFGAARVPWLPRDEKTRSTANSNNAAADVRTRP